VSALPPKIVVSPNQYALSNDVLALQYLLSAYHNMIAASAVGGTREGNEGSLANARGNGAIVAGCNVEYDSVSGKFLVSNGTAVMYNNSPDSSDFPSLPIYPFSKSLVAVLAQATPAPVQRATQCGWSLVYLKKSDQSFDQIRDFLNPSTGGTNPQVTQVMSGALGTVHVQTIWGSSTDPMDASIYPPEVSNYIDDIIVLAVMFIPDSSKPLLPEYVFDVRPLLTRQLPYPGEWKMTAKVDVDSGLVSSFFQARLAFTNTRDRDTIGSSENGDWAASSSFVNGVPFICTLYTTPKAYQSTWAGIDLPALNVVWEDGSFRRMAPKAWGDDTLADAGSILNALPINDHHWAYVYACKSRTTNARFFVVSTDPPTDQSYDSVRGERTGMKAFTTNPPILNSSVAAGDLVGRCVGILPFQKTAGNAYRFRASYFDGSKLTFPEPYLIQEVDLPKGTTDKTTDPVAIDMSKLPAYGLCHIRITLTATARWQLPVAPVTAYVRSYLRRDSTNLTYLNRYLDTNVNSADDTWHVVHTVDEYLTVAEAAHTYNIVISGTTPVDTRLLADPSDTYFGDMRVELISVTLPESGCPLLGTV